MKRIAIIPTVTEAYLFVWQQRQDFGLIAAPIALFLGVASAVLHVLRPPPNSELTVNVGVLLLTIGFAVVFGAALTVFAVAWHRRCLVPGYSSTVADELRWSRRHNLFLGRFVLLALLTIAASTLIALPVGLAFAVVGGVGSMVGILFLVVIVFLIEARFMLVLPAAALDRKQGFGNAWTRSAGNGARIAAILILTSMPISIAFKPIDWLLSAILVTFNLVESVAALFLLALVQSMIGLIVTACGVAGLSFCYRDLGA